jgi:hypothetical protein
MTTLTANFLDTRYGTLREFITAAQSAPRNSANSEHIAKWDNGCSDLDVDWGGAETTGAAVEAMTAFYEAGDAIIKRVEKAALNITLPPKMDTRRRRVRGDHGDSLDIHSVYRGQLDRAWERMGRRQVTAPPMVSIVINSIIQATSDKTVISYRGAVGIVLCQLLERYGYRVRLVVARGGQARSYSGKDETFSCRTIVKDYGKPLDRETVACATHPAMQRVLGIRWTWAQMHGKGTMTGSGVGEAIREKGEIFISSEVSNETSAIAKIKSVIAEITK